MTKNKKRKYARKTAETKEEKVPNRTRSSQNRELLAGNSEIEDGIQVERREAYVEPLAREVLRNLIESREEGEIIPSYNPASGFTYYPKMPQKGNGPQKIPRDFLENLARLNILQKSFYDSVSTCPNCESPALTMHPSCPKCKSHHIEKACLTEHIPCGYIDQSEKYTTNLCPKCGKRLVEGEYRNMGRWYVCNECDERFEHPQFNLICSECNVSFATEQAKVMEIPKFTLNPKRKKEIRQNVASLENISNLLTDLDFKIEMPGSITGHKSGIEYHFSILARKQTKGNEVVIAVDHQVAENEIQAPPVILYIYKISEMKVNIPIFIALPKLSEAAKRIAKGHDILIIEGSPEGPERIAQIKTEIESRINQSNAVQLKPKTASKSEMKSREKLQIPENMPVRRRTKRKGSPFKGVLKKFKASKNTKHKTEHPTVPGEDSKDISGRNIVFLLDGSSSMKKGSGDLSNFEVASKAIETILTNPDSVERNDVLSLIIFWDELIRGFQKKVLYETVPMNKYINPEKLVQFRKPRYNAGTPLKKAIQYTIGFLKGKKGKKIIKLITDAIDIPPLMDDAIISKLEDNSIELDCIVIGSKGNLDVAAMTSNYKRGRFFESTDVEALALELKS